MVSSLLSLTINIFYSSGTTEGRPKYLPFTHHSARTTLQTFRLAAALRSRSTTQGELAFKIASSYAV